MWSGEEGVLWWASKIVRATPRRRARTAPHTKRARADSLHNRFSAFALLRAPQAYAMCFVLIGGWILFRFVGPAVGLYTLKSGLTDIPGGR